MATDLAVLERLDRETAVFLEEMTRPTPAGRVDWQDELLLAIGSDPSPVIVKTILPVAPAVGPEAVARALGV